MLRFILRLALFVVGIVLVCDAMLPARIEALRVDQHTSATGRHGAGPSQGRLDTEYTLHFSGGLVGSCSVGLAAYGAVNDGDAVSVESSRLIRYCTRISRGADTVYRFKRWRAWLALGGLLLIASGIGWAGSRGDDGPVIEL